MTLVVAPREDLSVEMWWRTPGDQNESDVVGTDLDLHLRHPLAESWDGPLDCFTSHPQLDWGAVGDPAGDPELADDDGAGPEVIRVAQEENSDILGAPYRVGVAYRRAESLSVGESYGPSEARLRVWHRGLLLWSSEPGFILERTGDFWEAAEVFTGAIPRVVPLDGAE